MRPSARHRAPGNGRHDTTPPAANPALMVVSELAGVLDDGYLDEIRDAAGDPDRYGRRIVAPHAGPAVLPVASATVLLAPLFRDPSRLT
ncbi:hypothetical protein [Streptomyces sp. AP-93]|uniref:hypothetical protein n=1 Tax=Streptomyces sp. AP-93 TaxID=2929048 RepID=UPI001FB025B5|nr:hypothetical protein [Streptomyces sp. AP-93]MCJ0869069.1 hypothetical protein [Streptomyces sp. AP-93]